MPEKIALPMDQLLASRSMNFIVLENVQALALLTSIQPPMPPDHVQFPGADTISPILYNCALRRAGKR